MRIPIPSKQTIPTNFTKTCCITCYHSADNAFNEILLEDHRHREIIQADT